MAILIRKLPLKRSRCLTQDLLKNDYADTLRKYKICDMAISDDVIHATAYFSNTNKIYAINNIFLRYFLQST